MDKVAHYSELSLKQLNAIEDVHTGNQIINHWVVPGDEQTQFSSGKTIRSGLNETRMASRSQILYVNFEDNSIYRHWSMESQTFVGGDTLLTALDSGWEIRGTVLRQLYSCTGNRCTCVYHLDLHRGGERISMNVIENPWVKRRLHQLPVELYTLEVQE